MRKLPAIIILLFLLLDCVRTAEAQPIGLTIGPRVGVNLSAYSKNVNFGSVLLDRSSTSGNITRVNAGIALNAKVNVFFTVQAEGMFINNGGYEFANTFSGTNLTPVNREYTTNLDYIQFAVIPKFTLPTSQHVNFFGGIGPYAAFLTSAKERLEQSTFQQNLTTERDISGSISGSDFGLMLSGGVNISEYTIEARYYLGLKNLIDDPSIPDDVSAKNSTVSFLIGYNFSL